uniref:Uncharacterized protein n=1 Tax=Rhizophora mucronata TaxID=61149 RepID=A0A2P2MYG9_RHIMU
MEKKLDGHHIRIISNKIEVSSSVMVLHFNVKTRRDLISKVIYLEPRRTIISLTIARLHII